MTAISLAPPLRTKRTQARLRKIAEPTGFGRSTRVRTLMGWQPVDSLMAGDLVLDSAGNPHELRSIRQFSVHGRSVMRIRRNSRAPLTVGTGQMMAADDWRTQVVFGQTAICPAARMADGHIIRRGQRRSTVLFQLHFDATVQLDLDGAPQAVVTPPV